MAKDSKANAEAIQSLINSAMKSSTRKTTTAEIDHRFAYIQLTYALGALFKKCNFVKCTKKNPGKQIVINESQRTGKTRELASLYLCDKHVKNADALQRTLASMTRGAEIVISVRTRV